MKRSKHKAVLLSLSQAAEEFGRHRQTIARRIRALKIPSAGTRHGHAVYRVKDLLEIERHGLDDDADPENFSPTLRHIHYKTESERMKFIRESAELIPVEACERESARVLAVVMRELDTMPEEIAQDIAPSAAVLEKISEKVEQIRLRIRSE